MLKANILLLALIMTGSPIHAANTYNTNTAHRITHVLTYTYDATILFHAENMPAIPGCAGNYFVIPNDASLDTRHQILSRLLIAYSTREIINIGYDGVTCGPGGYIMVHRVG